MKYATFKFYDDKGRRLAIFSDGEVITVIPCAKADQFSKSKARELFNTDGIYREQYEVKNELHKDFMKWCFEHYKQLNINYIVNENGLTINVKKGKIEIKYFL